ncbi:hypothetical protein SAE02_54500 [Skermanella aerolata]|uniref:Uncharacterized protein n=1 Tax=Skermanella aerolata TaxID=393310 RepID=A0A512DXU4_9PROT|nr:hypothetical protein [Skermanella aerolata]KJB93947.1 hypothetical protein N826_13240 [Skermanella aerolata KACC 11604]GEO41302.1 hypothetical protein SAE02_54500 [Skermanella aerolata]
MTMTLRDRFNIFVQESLDEFREAEHSLTAAVQLGDALVLEAARSKALRFGMNSALPTFHMAD